MEDFYNPKKIEIKIISVGSKILISMVLIFMVLLKYFPINQSVKSMNGEIIGNSKKINYHAPFEGKPIIKKIKEGDSVSKGDTLMVINNENVKSQVKEKIVELSELELKKEKVSEKLELLYRKISNIKSKIDIESDGNEIDMLSNNYKIESLKNQLKISLDELEIAKSKFKSDSILYADSVISKRDYEESYKGYLIALTNNNQIKSNLNSEILLFSKNKNSLESVKNGLYKELLSYREEEVNLKEELVSCENQINGLKDQLSSSKKVSSEQYIISELNGEITYLFNAYNKVNRVMKDEILLSISPINKDLFAKLYVNENDLWNISIGQSVNIKLDNFYEYTHGTILGRVDYISEDDYNGNGFYLLVSLKDLDKHRKFLKRGFKVKGDIIVGKMNLAEYLIKELFGTVESKS